MRKFILGMASLLMMSLVFVSCDDDNSDTRDEIVGEYSGSIVTKENKKMTSSGEVIKNEKKYDGKIKIEKTESDFSNSGVSISKWDSDISSYSSYKSGSYKNGKLTIDASSEQGSSSTTINDVTTTETWDLKYSYTSAPLDGSNLSISGAIIGTGTLNEAPYVYSATEVWTLLKL